MNQSSLKIQKNRMLGTFWERPKKVSVPLEMKKTNDKYLVESGAIVK